MTDFNSKYLDESIWDIRRKAPFHFLAKASNARMSAYALSHIEDDFSAKLALDAGYCDSINIALHEAFMRESAIAVELILKAILCVKEKKAPVKSHDVYDLWTKAGLPSPSDDDAYRLADMCETLYWAGRYAAPATDKHILRQDKRFERHQRTSSLGKLKVTEPTPFDWEHFDALYQAAHLHFWELKPNDPSSFVA